MVQNMPEEVEMLSARKCHELGEFANCKLELGVAVQDPK
jgi:hypothetical protein